MKVFRALLLSVCVHLLLMGLLRWFPSEALDRSLTQQVAEIQIIETPRDHLNSPQIVREAELPDHLKDKTSDEKARFLSAQDQRVLIESRARETGLTRNSKSPAIPHDSWLKKYMARSEQMEASQEKRPKDPDGVTPRPIALPSPKEYSQIGFEGAPATTGELLPDDVSMGEFTALNTDRFKFYSFYARVEELVRFRWEQGLQQAINSLDPNQLKHVHRDKWITEVEFWLSSDGSFHSAHIHRESGLSRLDRAAVNAFREARFFPNPPPEIVGRDGKIRLQYSFTVRWSPQAFVGR